MPHVQPYSPQDNGNRYTHCRLEANCAPPSCRDGDGVPFPSNALNSNDRDVR